MDLILRNGYPSPYPSGPLSASDEERLKLEACGRTMVLHGVVGFEWTYTLTVDFESEEAAAAAQAVTYWDRWGDDWRSLEADTDDDRRGEHPAILAGDYAWTGFMLVAEDAT